MGKMIILQAVQLSGEELALVADATDLEAELLVGSAVLGPDDQFSTRHQAI